MKILQVINSLGLAGAERLVSEMAPIMNHMGHQTDVLVFNGTKSAFICDLQKQGVTVHVLGQKNGEYNPMMVFRLKHYLNAYDIVHVHLFPSQYWVALAAKIFGSRAKIVTTEHNNYNARCKYWLTSWMDRKVYSCYDAITVISDATLEFMKKRSPESVPLYLIINGVNVEKFTVSISTRDRLLPQIGNDKFILMQVACFRLQKNQACLIRALKHLPDNVVAVFVGDGETMDACRSLAKNMNLESRTYFLGSRNDVPELLALADIAVMSSHWEGFGLSAVEAMASGKPVIASDVDGLKQVVEGYGLIFREDDAIDLSIKILSLYNDPDVRKQMAERCRLRSLDFDIRHMVRSYLDCYQKIINQN